MKNSKGETLPQPYFDLAMMRREKQEGNEFRKYWDITFEKHGLLSDAFNWHDTPEKDVWYSVYEGDTPEIPASSLAELEAWRKSREENKQSEFWGKAAMVADELRPEPDYKAMYEELSQKVTELQKKYDENGYECSPTIKLQRMEQHFDLIERTSSTHDRNWIAECSMGIMAETGECDTAWNRAEAWAAEGKKRGHLPKTDNA